MWPLHPVRRGSPATWETAWPFLLAYVALYGRHCEVLLGEVPPGGGVLSRSALREFGVGDYVLAWLLFQGHADYFHLGIDAPQFEGVFPEEALFGLAAAGAAFAGEFLRRALVGSDQEYDEVRGEIRIGILAPRYALRAFTWGVHLIKRFLQPAGSQVIVLEAAEELGWPGWFDDPLPRRKGRNPKSRLLDTIKDLNRRQRCPLVHFRGDGTGTRVGWELRLPRQAD